MPYTTFNNFSKPKLQNAFIFCIAVYYQYLEGVDFESFKNEVLVVQPNPTWANSEKKRFWSNKLLVGLVSPFPGVNSKLSFQPSDTKLDLSLICSSISTSAIRLNDIRNSPRCPTLLLTIFQNPNFKMLSSFALRFIIDI